jgi:hypothetical protein
MEFPAKKSGFSPGLIAFFVLVHDRLGFFLIFSLARAAVLLVTFLCSFRVWTDRF